MYILSDGTETNSRYQYLNDSIKFGLSINPYSVPNSKIGIEFSSNNIKGPEKLLVSNSLKHIDESLSLDSIEVVDSDINLRIKYPYGIVKAEL